MAGEDSQLKVAVGTTYDGSGIDAANKAISGFSKKTTQELDEVGKVAKNSSNSLSQGLAKAAAITANSGQAIKKGSDQAAFALTNLGRVAQDAPFGFIGIQNNLNPLLESFQRLKAETGSSKAALSALTTSLLGPAGLGIALSVVSSAIVLYQQYQQKSTKADEEKEKAQRKAIDANEAYFKSLSSIEQINVKGIQNAQKELISLEQLYFAARNVKLSMDERYKAAAALQDQYPNTFNNFSKEEIAIGKASQAYKGLADDILSVARASAATDIIVENTKKLTLEQLKYNKAQKDLKDINAQIAALPAQDNRAVGSAGIGSSSAATQTTRQQNDLLAKQAELTKTINSSQKVKTSLVKENLDIQKLVNKEVEKEGVVALTGIDRTAKKVEKIKESLSRDNRTIGNTNISTPNISGDLSSDILPDLNIRGVTTGLSEYIKLMQEAYRSNERFTESVDDLVASTLESGLSQAFEAIGQSLADGTSSIEAFGSAILSAFANFLSQLGQMFIKEGIAQIGYGIAKNLILPGSGAGNIAGGLGMIGAGAAISVVGGAGKSLSGKSNKNGNQNITPIRQFADGGVISGPTYGLMGEYPGARSNPEVVAPLNKLKSMIGDNRGAVYIEGNLDLSLEKLSVRLKQVDKRLNRLGV